MQPSLTLGTISSPQDPYASPYKRPPFPKGPRGSYRSNIVRAVDLPVSIGILRASLLKQSHVVKKYQGREVFNFLRPLKPRCFLNSSSYKVFSWHRKVLSKTLCQAKPTVELTRE